MKELEISKVINHLRDCDMSILPSTVKVSIPDSKEQLASVMMYLEPNLQW